MFAAGKASSGGLPSDPYFNYVTMLLHGDGTNGGQNNTFLDSSTNNFTITRNGNTTQGSFSPYGSLWSNFALDTSTNNGLSWTFNGSPAQTAVGGTNYTIEFWVNRATRSGSYQSMFSTEGDRNNFIVDPSNNLLVRSNGGTSMFTVAANTYIPVGVWTHVALVCSDTTWTLYFNGVSYGTYSGASKTNGPNGNAWLVGRNDMNGCGYMSNFRISTVARYSGNFTPSTTPFTTDASTAMLACQSNRFVDVSANAQTFTINGTMNVTNFAPFNPTAAYSTATNGGSGYFDGSGDYLVTGSNSALAMGTGDFTWEGWIYFPSGSSYRQIFSSRGSTGLGGSLAVNPSNGLTWYTNGFIVNYTTSIGVNQWNHVAVTRSGTTLRVFANGVQVGSATNSQDMDRGVISLGANNPGDETFTGYISNVRIVKGTAVYTGAYTVPTAPLSAISGTSLLCNFTNGAIFDNSTKNNLETAGNAQISTSVKKFGTGSLYFDGTGDWCNTAPTTTLEFGGGNFTMEFWLYPVDTTRRAIYHGSSGTDWSIGIDWQSQKICIWASSNGTSWDLINADGGGNGIGTITVALNTWTHVAFVRSGTTWQTYINGVRDLNLTGISGSIVDRATSQKSIGKWFFSDGVGSPTTWNGYIDDFRVTKGVARYTANFTPPTAAFPNQ